MIWEFVGWTPSLTISKIEACPKTTMRLIGSRHKLSDIGYPLITSYIEDHVPPTSYLYTNGRSRMSCLNCMGLVVEATPAADLLHIAHEAKVQEVFHGLVSQSDMKNRKIATQVTTPFIDLSKIEYKRRGFAARWLEKGGKKGYHCWASSLFFWTALVRASSSVMAATSKSLFGQLIVALYRSWSIGTKAKEGWNHNQSSKSDASCFASHWRPQWLPHCTPFSGNLQISFIILLKEGFYLTASSLATLAWFSESWDFFSLAFNFSIWARVAEALRWVSLRQKQRRLFSCPWPCKTFYSWWPHFVFISPSLGLLVDLPLLLADFPFLFDLGRVPYFCSQQMLGQLQKHTNVSNKVISTAD